jgi:hypothetical protein
MSRPLKIQYPDAWYHVMNRGRRDEVICPKKCSSVSSVIERMKGELSKNGKMRIRVEKPEAMQRKSQEQI